MNLRFFSVLLWLVFGYWGFAQPAYAAAQLTLPAVSYDGRFTAAYQTFNDPTGRVYLTLSKNSGTPSYWYGALERTGSHRYSGLSTGVYTVKIGYQFSIYVIRNNHWLSGGKDVVVVRAPGRPSGMIVPTHDIQHGEMALTWGGGSGLLNRYQLQQSKDGGGWVTLYNGSRRSRTVTGLNDGEYRYRVRACKDLAGYSNCSAWRTASTTVSVLNVPGLPGPLNGPAAEDDGEFTLSWNTASGTVDHYRLEQRRGAGDWQLIQSDSLRSKNMTLTQSGVYYFRVQACNSSGCSAYGDDKQVNVNIPLSAPAAPVFSRVPSSADFGDYEIEWQAAGGVVSYYQLQEKRNNGDWAGVALNTDFRYEARGKREGQYQYRINACNEADCSEWTHSPLIDVHNLDGIAPVVNITAANQPGSPDYSVNVSASGDAVISIPLLSVPGVNHTAPALTLHYSSGRNR